MDSKALSSAQRPTLCGQVARHVLELVNREQLRPGDRVPSEVQIGRDLKVSRGSVREAYRTLSALGILEIESGRRPRLRPICPQALAQVVDYALTTAQVEVAHVLETRRAIELQTARLAAIHATDAQREKLRALIVEMRSAEDSTSRAAHDLAVHMLIAEASGNPLNGWLLSALRSPLDDTLRVGVYAHGTESEVERVLGAHDAVVERICAGDAEGAAAAMSRHFELSPLNVNRGVSRS